MSTPRAINSVLVDMSSKKWVPLPCRTIQFSYSASGFQVLGLIFMLNEAILTPLTAIGGIITEFREQIGYQNRPELIISGQ